ncbi:thiamine pyrophosphate enzyme, N-terminal TPP binding domain-containing protein [Infundibulicybe gibba]|nr:thiamine pyrophosphate enzyme, N-terminal TPP binding domain-containing protein [Infundibulicybe gibba]
MYSTSSVFLKTLAEAGITHAFVNWGSDHPALLEDLERQRVESQGETAPKIVTCPNEMVALSAAQGYAQVTGKPAAVIVHVDVGTQALAGAVHNVDRNRTPVLIYAGASPFSSNNELRGSRNEWIMWLQDIPDQAAIVRQYMRYTSQIHSGSTVSQVVRRSLQIAMSEPKGPVYLWARREAMEEEVGQAQMEAEASLQKWPPIEPCALTPAAANRIATALLTSQSPLIITSYLGRNQHAVAALVALSTLLAIPVVLSCPSVVNIPMSHPFYAGITYLIRGTHSDLLATADTILVIDSDFPWVPANDRPRDSARVFVIDGGDPIKENIGFWHVGAEVVARADSEIALEQIVQAVRKIDDEGANVGEAALGGKTIRDRADMLTKRHKAMLESLKAAEDAYPVPSSSGPRASFTVPNLIGVLRKTIQGIVKPQSDRLGTLFLNEAISNFPSVWAHLLPERPGSVITSGGSSLGWALAAAVGASIGGTAQGKKHDLIVAIVGDGSFLFGVPSSAFWIARKYNTPFLTIVLNNGGWNASSPKLSMLGVHPTGLGSRVSGQQLSVGFGPECPDYSQIAVAASAGWAWGKRVFEGGREALEATLAEAVKVVVEEGRCAVVDCVIDTI